MPVNLAAVGSHLNRYAYKGYLPTIAAGSVLANQLIPGRPAAFREAYANGVVTGLTGGGTAQDVAEAAANGMGAGLGKGIVSGIKQEGGKLVDWAKSNPGAASGVAATALGVPILWYILSKTKKQSKTAAVIPKVMAALNPGNPAGMGARNYALVVGASAVPAAATGLAVRNVLKDDNSFATTLAAHPEEAASSIVNKAVDAAGGEQGREVINSALSAAARYPIEHPLQTAGLLATTALPLYLLHKLINRNKKTAGWVGNTSGLAAGAFGIANLIDPTMVGHAAGSATGKIVNGIDTGVANAAGTDPIASSIKSTIAEAPGDLERVGRDSATQALDATGKFIADNKYMVAGTAGIGALLLYKLLKKPSAPVQHRS